MNPYPTLSKNDRIIMDVIWERGEISNADILTILGRSQEWTRDAVKTYVKRLVDKGLVGINSISPRKHRYYPLVEKDTFLANATKQYLEQNYEGLSYMVAGLIRNEKITMEEIDELEQLIKDYKEK